MIYRFNKNNKGVLEIKKILKSIIYHKRPSINQEILSKKKKSYGHHYS
jgi:hypothetical protein